jgi:hypothetical protein
MLRTYDTPGIVWLLKTTHRIVRWKMEQLVVGCRTGSGKKREVVTSVGPR